jgi:hypothetical protein
MPATLLLVVALVGWVPLLVDRAGGQGWIFRAWAVFVLVVAVAGHLRTIQWWLDQKRYAVSRGVDAFLAGDVRGVAVNAAVEDLATRLGAGETLAVLPEGAMVNYLARRSNSAPYVTLMPPELIAFGEERVLASFQSRPPDYVLLAHKDTTEYGARFFGRDYGQRIVAWVNANYREAALIGAPPLRDERFGMLLLRRRDSP